MRYAGPVFANVVRPSRLSALVALGALGTILVCGPAGAVCSECCPGSSGKAAAFSSASCCGEDCGGAALEKGSAGPSCVPASRAGTTGPSSVSAILLPTPVLIVAGPRFVVPPSASPPFERVPTALRL